MNARKSLSLMLLVWLVAGLLPLAAVAQPPPNGTGRPPTSLEAEAAPNLRPDSIVEGAPQTLAGLFQPGLPYDPAVAQAAIASAEQSLAAQGQDESASFGWQLRLGPLAQDNHAMAYDSARGVTVLFEGTRGSGGTWEWDGASWTQRYSAHKPSARYGHALAYDSARDVTVLFGGEETSLGWVYLDDTWEWDGTDWTRRFPANKPSPREAHAMAYDTARGVTVLFGGYYHYYESGHEYDFYYGDTWEWDGTDWTKRSLAYFPDGRSGHAMAYDSARGVTVLFGGHYGGSETWEWDGVNWTQRSPAHRPTARSLHAMAYDSGRGVTVLFGGYDGSYRDDTWEWDGTDWTLRSPTTKPTPRDGHAMAYDSARGMTVLFGGYRGITYPPFDDTWDWDGTDWTQRLHRPTARDSHALAYDSAQGMTVLFGGYDGRYIPHRQNDTWEWDGTDWAQRSPPNKPSARYDHALAYDSVRGVTVLFGGYDGSIRLDDTWEWDGVNWTQRSPAHRPAARDLHALAYDSGRGVTILFGGYDGSYRFDDTWEWDGTDWAQRSPPNKPSTRYDHALAYDSVRGVTVLFGGYDGSIRLDDTWEWDGVNWTQRSPAHRPTARSLHAMAYDSGRGVTVLFGGYDGTYLDDTWEWDGTDWTQGSPATMPRARDSHAMAYDGARGVTVLFGGTYLSADLVYLYDTWEYRPPPLPRPTLASIDNPDGDGDYLVAWSTVAEALSYTLHQDGDPGFSSPVICYQGNETQYQVTGQPTGTWYYRVCAENVEGESYWSDSQAVVVLPTAPARVYLPLVVRNH